MIFIVKTIKQWKFDAAADSDADSDADDENKTGGWAADLRSEAAAMRLTDR